MEQNPTGTGVRAEESKCSVMKEKAASQADKREAAQAEGTIHAKTKGRKVRCRGIS